jgi:Ni,Fe-hydrogenase I large subunit
MPATKKTSKPRRPSPNAAPPEIRIRPGWMIIPEFTAAGGVSREILDRDEEEVGPGLEIERKTRETVDNVELLRESRSIVNACYHILDKYASQTHAGYFADEHQLAQIEEALKEQREAARMFNDIAYRAGCARRVTVDIMPCKLDLDFPATVVRIARMVRERITALRDALKAGNRKAFESAIDRCHNLHHMAVGIQSESIKLALDHAKEQKSLLLEHMRDGDDPAMAAKKLDLEPLDACINLFSTEVA